MNAIPAVPPINDAINLAKSSSVLERPSVGAADLTQKFGALMQRAEATQHVVAPTGQNVLATVLDNAQGKLSAAEGHLNSVMAALPGMDPSEASAASAMVAQEVGQANAQVQIASSLVSASKGSLDSLLKNQ